MALSDTLTTHNGVLTREFTLIRHPNPQVRADTWRTLVGASSSNDLFISHATTGPASKPTTKKAIVQFREAVLDEDGVYAGTASVTLTLQWGTHPAVNIAAVKRCLAQTLSLMTGQEFDALNEATWEMATRLMAGES